MKGKFHLSLRLICLGIVITVVLHGAVKYFLEQSIIESSLGHLAICPINFLTNFLCPGCGMTRAFLLIGELNFIEALNLNPLSFPFFLFMLFFVTSKHKFHMSSTSLRITLIVAVSMLFITRNF